MAYTHDYAKNGRRGTKVIGCNENVYCNIKTCIKEKIKVLKELYIFLTPEEEAHLKSLTNEVDVDAYAHELIMHKL